MFIEVKRGIVRGRVETPKSGKSRRVDMSRQLATVLKQHITNTKEETLSRGWKHVPATLFYSKGGNPLDPRNVVQRYFNKCLEALKKQGSEGYAFTTSDIPLLRYISLKGNPWPM